jgi:DNA-binding NtrC family response regulator
MQNGHDVLVVEDDGPTRSLLVAIVHRNGYRPVEAKDGKSAFVLLEAAMFRAVLLDLLLPEMSGLEILRHMTSAKPEMLSRVAVITAALELTRRAEVKRARTVVAKPFEVHDVERALRLCCE